MHLLYSLSNPYRLLNDMSLYCLTPTGSVMARLCIQYLTPTCSLTPCICSGCSEADIPLSLSLFGCGCRSPAGAPPSSGRWPSSEQPTAASVGPAPSVSAEHGH